jgi:mRNA-degrading endonuclease RelE of RelBE toxin-antitoxin system
MLKGVIAESTDAKPRAELEASMSRKLKVGVFRGDGPPPGYKWNVRIVDFVFDEAMKFLDEDQYEHLAKQFRELALQDDPSHSLTISIDAIEDFHELRDKGGVLHRLNVRVFYYIDSETRSIVVVGAISKQNNGPTPQTVKIRIRRRVRAYLQGEYGERICLSAGIEAVKIRGGKLGP